jgi:hypothetical protein
MDEKTISFYFVFLYNVFMKNALLLFLVYLIILPLICSANITSLEADPTLESHVESSLQTSLNRFLSKGGTFIRQEGDKEAFPLLEGDIVYPSCSGGSNRSQTLWNLLRPYSDKIRLKQPHATQYGFDPYNGQANWLRQESSNMANEFQLWAGIPKSPKFGSEKFDSWLTKTSATPEELEVLTDYFNREYYNPNVPPGTRRIYITFGKNAHIHLYRLSQTNESLKNVFVLFYPLEDLIKNPPDEWNAAPRSIKTYVELSKLISRYLDLSAIQ